MKEGRGSSKGASVKCFSVKEAARPITVSEDSHWAGQTREGHPHPMSWETQQSVGQDGLRIRKAHLMPAFPFRGNEAAAQRP